MQEDFRQLKEKDLNALASAYSTNSKSKPYIPRYDTENRKTPNKLKEAQKHTNTSSNLSKCYLQPPAQEASFHRTYHHEDANRSHSRDEQLRKQHSRIGSIHLLSKKSSLFSKK